MLNATFIFMCLFIDLKEEGTTIEISGGAVLCFRKCLCYSPGESICILGEFECLKSIYEKVELIFPFFSIC